MQYTWRYFDDQTELSGVFEKQGGVKKVIWRLPDNSEIHLSRPQLKSILDEVENQKAIRTARLYARKRQIKGNGRLFDEVFSDWI